MEWKINKLKNSGSNYIATYSFGQVTGDISFALPDGKKYEDLTQLDVISYVKTSINTMADGSTKESNSLNIEETAKKLEEESSSVPVLPWGE